MNIKSILLVFSIVFIFACNDSENKSPNYETIENIDQPKIESISSLNVIDSIHPLQENDLKIEVTIGSVYNRYIEAVGGKEKLELIKNFHQTGKMIDDGEVFDLSLLMKEKDKIKFVISKKSINVLSQIINGNEGIQYQKGQKSTIENKELVINLLNVNLLSGQSLEDYGLIAKLLGTVDFNSEECHVVEITRSDVLYLTEYYSVLSGLKIGSESEFLTPEGVVSVTSIYKNHQNFGGIILPALSEQIVGDKKLFFSIESMKLNTSISNNEFLID